jgi:hypothetical protein
MRAPLKHRAPLLFCLLALACAQEPAPNPSPADRFYFPTSLAFFLPPDSTSGILYVASSNYDRRYDQGNLLAVNLDNVQAPGSGLDGGLPFLGTFGGDTTPALQFTTLNTNPSTDAVQIQSFAGEMLRDPVGYGGRPRLWVATRAEGDLLEGVSSDPSGEGLVCIPAGNNCVFSGISLAIEQEPQGGSGQPAAPQPYGLALSAEASIVPGELWVTHIRPADSPPTSDLDLDNYLVHLDARAAIPVVNVPNNFVSIGLGSGNSVFVGQSNVWVSGRAQLTITALDVLMRVVDRFTDTTFFPQLALQFADQEARSLAVRSDESRIYLVGLRPDTLLVVDVIDPFTQFPTLVVVRAVALPSGPNAIRLLKRPSTGGDVLVITCQDDGSLAVYDDDIGQLALIVEGVGIAPYDVVVDQRGNLARFFVSNFDDGRVAVIDASLGGDGQPFTARIVATLGQQQGCILTTNNASCVGSE